MSTMDVLEELPYWRSETAATEGARRLAGLYLTHAVAGAHQPPAGAAVPDPWTQAAAGLLGRTVPLGLLLGPATTAIDAWRNWCELTGAGVPTRCCGIRRVSTTLS